jgi:hypothetical protein
MADNIAALWQNANHDGLNLPVFRQTTFGTPFAMI